MMQNDLSIYDELADDIRDFVADLTYNIAEEIVLDIAVDSGRARSNVIVSAGFPNIKNNPPFFDYGKNSGENKKETLNAKFAIAAIKAEVKEIQPFQNVYITNNAANPDTDFEYSGLLDEGYSRQTRKGMTDRAIVKGLKKTEIKFNTKFKVTRLKSYAV